MTYEITFILPTWNRREYVLRAIESCLACKSEILTPYVLVIDGQSDDGSYELMLEKYQKNPQVRIIQNAKGTGFQRTAFQGVSEVRTEYATFMYDDDILSPHFKTLFQKMVESKKDFAMGYGKAYDVRKVYPFQDIRAELVPKVSLIDGYFGDVDAVKYFGLPVSPIALITTADHLRRWVQFSQDFARHSKMRWYFMIEKNIGPDIIIYLSGILKEASTVLQAQNIIAQFSSHPESMSIQYGVNPLTVGYWIGRIWAFEEICKTRDNRLIAKSAGYLLVSGARIFLKLTKSLELKWAFSVLCEMAVIKVVVLRRFLIISTLKNCVDTLVGRYRRRSAEPLPN